MKKYLLGFLAVVLAVGFSAFTKPAKKAFANYYRFSYIISNGFSLNSVENETPTFWGYGTLVTNPNDFTLACDGIEDKPCELTVPEASTVSTASGRRMKSTQAGDSGSGLVAISANLGSETSVYKVSGGTNVSALMNKD